MNRAWVKVIEKLPAMKTADKLIKNNLLKIELKIYSR